MLDFGQPAGVFLFHQARDKRIAWIVRDNGDGCSKKATSKIIRKY
jgi:hypothetical protein